MIAAINIFAHDAKTSDYSSSRAFRDCAEKINTILANYSQSDVCHEAFNALSSVLVCAAPKTNICLETIVSAFEGVSVGAWIYLAFRDTIKLSIPSFTIEDFLRGCFQKCLSNSWINALVTIPSIISFLDRVSSISNNSKALQSIAIVISAPPAILGTIQVLFDALKGFRGLLRFCGLCMMTEAEKSKQHEREREYLNNQIETDEEKLQKINNQTTEQWAEEQVLKLNNKLTEINSKEEVIIVERTNG